MHLRQAIVKSLEHARISIPQGDREQQHQSIEILLDLRLRRVDHAGITYREPSKTWWPAMTSMADDPLNHTHKKGGRGNLKIAMKWTRQSKNRIGIKSNNERSEFFNCKVLNNLWCHPVVDKSTDNRKTMFDFFFYNNRAKSRNLIGSQPLSIRVRTDT